MRTSTSRLHLDYGNSAPIASQCKRSPSSTDRVATSPCCIDVVSMICRCIDISMSMSAWYPSRLRCDAVTLNTPEHDTRSELIPKYMCKWVSVSDAGFTFLFSHGLRTNERNLTREHNSDVNAHSEYPSPSKIRICVLR